MCPVRDSEKAGGLAARAFAGIKLADGGQVFLGAGLDREKGRTRGQAVTGETMILKTKVEGGFGIRKPW